MGGMASAGDRFGLGAITLAALLSVLCSLPFPAWAYTAAGDRLFPATAILPQIAPADAFYTWAWMLPKRGGPVGAVSESDRFAAILNKRITERLGIVVEEVWSRQKRLGLGSAKGFENLDTEIKYLAIDNQPHEFILSLGVEREFATGARRLGGGGPGATTPTVYFGKGFGDLDIGYLRPLALTGVAGFQVADSRPRPDVVTAGFTLEYSIPYLQSKVQALDLPEIVRGLTPMTEVSFAFPAGRSFGARTTALIAPGVSYAGQGWELRVAALVPATRATGEGVGVIAQFHVALDYLFPETLGRPLLSAR